MSLCLEISSTAINPGGNRLSQSCFMAQRLPFHPAGGTTLNTVSSCVTALLSGTLTKLTIFLFTQVSRFYIMGFFKWVCLDICLEL